MPSLTSWILQSSAVATFAAAATLTVYTKHCHFVPVSPTADSIFQNPWYGKLNPGRKEPAVHDLCVRKIPLWKVERELIDDAEAGGGKLVERFCGGVWGCFGYTPQRAWMTHRYRRDRRTSHQLWDKKALLESNYPEGTEITNHFQILQKTPNRILIRCGDSPLTSPSQPRDSDGLFEISARADLDKGFAEFRLKSCFFNGVVGENEEKVKKDAGTGKVLFDFAHRVYTRLLMESGIKNCML